MKYFRLFLLLLLLTFNLNANTSSTGSGNSNSNSNSYSRSNSYSYSRSSSSSSDTKQFDIWDYWIGDSHNLPKSDDRNISTKIAGKSFQLTLASIDKDDTKYEKKKASGNSTKDYSVEVSIYTNNKNNPTRISNTVTFDPTDDKYINKSDPITVNKAYKDAVVGIRMCATYDSDNSKYEMYELGECSGSDQDCTHDDNGHKEFKMCYATNNFAIRPKLYRITPVTPLISAKEKNFDVIAEDENGAATQNYSIDNDGKTDSNEAIDKIIENIYNWFGGSRTADTNTDDYNLTLTVTKYMPDDTVNDDLYGEGNITVYKFTDGNASENEGNITIYYNEVGKVTLTPMDINWSDVDEGDTDGNCSNGDDDPKQIGRFICGDTNTTYIPAHFAFHDAKLYDHNNSTFTYISNDTNMSAMSAHIGVTIEAQNDRNETTKNFDIDSWVNPISVDFNTTHEYNIKKNLIRDTNLSFEDGNYTIIWNDLNSSANLMFNYERNISDALNPFFIDGNDTNLTLYSLYPDDNNITDNNGTIVFIDGNATFLYGRTHAIRSRFKEANSNEYNVTIYYESFCNAKDASGVDCNKSLLPDGDSSLISDDPRWFINTKHNHTAHKVGLANNIHQKNGKNIVEEKIAPTGDYKDTVTLKLDTSNIKFPYITTMENNASSWLIYNKYNPNANTNEFEVEFNKDSSQTSWAGKVEDNTTGSTKSNATSITNRRSMW